MHHTPPADCLDDPNTAILRTPTAYYENTHPECVFPTTVQCYQAMETWCRAASKKKADIPDKGIVTKPSPTELLFQNCALHNYADPALKEECAAARTGVAEHRRADSQIDGRGQLIEHHYLIVPKAVASKAIQGVHSYSHPGMVETLELLHRGYKFVGYTTTQLRDLVENVVERRDTCQTCQPRCGQHPQTRHYYRMPKYLFTSVGMDIVHLPFEAVPRTPWPVGQTSVLPRHLCLFSTLLVGICFLQPIGNRHRTDPIPDLPD